MPRLLAAAMRVPTSLAEREVLSDREESAARSAFTKRPRPTACTCGCARVCAKSAPPREESVVA